jgi:hypothetical protein
LTLYGFLGERMIANALIDTVLVKICRLIVSNPILPAGKRRFEQLRPAQQFDFAEDATF